eukprot:NODE_361_length_8796_cov_0.460274.p1 type:complete len:337 gc:universal NODE_361_length_8796_cov_0.460274:4499-3489(-)
MRKYEQVSDLEHNYILGLKHGGMTHEQIRNTTGRSLSTISKHIKGDLKSFKENKAKNMKQGSSKNGKPRNSEEKYIVLMSKKRFHSCLKSLYNDVAPKCGYKQFLRKCNYLGIKTYKKTKCQLLNKEQRKKRVNWCKKYKNYDFNYVLFSDESYLELDNSGGCTTVRMKGEPVKEWDKVKTRKFPPKMLLWAYIHAGGGGSIVVSDGTVNAVTYEAILRESFLPNYRFLEEHGYVLQQDNASAHTAEIVTDFLDENGIDVIEWPPNSPDLSPIENIWAYLKKAIGERGTPENFDELLKWVTEMWDEICEKHCPKLYESIPRRIEMCLKNNGNTTKY